jgi:CHAD domain-containing protein
MPPFSAKPMMAQNARPDESPAQVPAALAAKRALRARCDAVAAALKRARRGSRIEPQIVHKMRVASRRLSALLEVLADWFPKRERQTLARRSRRLRRKCGRVRDLDVQLASLASCKSHVGPGETRALALAIALLERQRQRKRRKLQAWLERFAERFSRDGRRILQAIERHQHAAMARQATFADIGVRMMTKAAGKLWSGAHDFSTTKGLHRFRIAVKRLRYVNEIFLPALDPSFRDDFQPQLVHIQDVLGEIQNAVTALKLLRRCEQKLRKRRLTAKGKKVGPRGLSDAELTEGLAAARRAFALQQEKALREFLELWPGFAGDSFRHPFEALVNGPFGGETKAQQPSQEPVVNTGLDADSSLPLPGNPNEPLP